jgi:hypothetical protein
MSERRALRIDHNPPFFKVNRKREQYRADLRAMPQDRDHDIWPALTTFQRQLAIRLGHSAPPPSLPPLSQ